MGHRGRNQEVQTMEGATGESKSCVGTQWVRKKAVTVTSDLEREMPPGKTLAIMSG